MRIALSIIFVVLTLILGVCAFFAYRNKKPIGKTVSYMIIALIPPVVGNAMIIASENLILSTVGCYVYFIGMDVVMFTLINFTYKYCNITKGEKIVKIILYTLLALDVLQILANIFTSGFHPENHEAGHVFHMHEVEVFDAIYFQYHVHWGLWIHRVIDYGILTASMVAFLLKTIFSPNIYRERYIVVLIAMVIAAVWQSIYILTGTPVDISMTAFAAFGVLIFILTLYYRPLKLLDRMLATIAARMSEAIFFFDTTDRCIWVNKKALDILKISEDELHTVTSKLVEKIGKYSSNSFDWSKNVVTGVGDNITAYAVERHPVIDDKNKTIGSYIIMRDNSLEQKTLQKETYNATHDSLTKALNRLGYDNKMDNIDLSKCFLLLIDLDSFKATNDEFGHTVGDQVLIKIVETITANFRDMDFVCRIGGDEFAVIIPNADVNTPKFVEERINRINNSLENDGEDLPLTTISAGGAFGKDAENSYELFNNADHALYETKFSGKRGFTLFKKR